MVFLICLCYSKAGVTRTVVIPDGSDCHRTVPDPTLLIRLRKLTDPEGEIMTIEQFRELMQPDRAYPSDTEIDQAFGLIYADANNDCEYLDDFIVLCQKLATHATESIMDKRVHRCSNAYIVNIENKHNEQEDKLFFLYNLEAEYFTLQNSGTETIYYAEKLLELKHIQPEYHAAALIYIMNVFASTGLPEYFERYAGQLNALRDGNREGGLNIQLLPLNLMDLYSMTRDYERYTEACEGTEHIYDSLPDEHPLKGLVKMHRISTAYAFPELVGQKTAEEVVTDLCFCGETLHGLQGIVDSVAQIFRPMLETARKLMPLQEFVASVQKIIGGSIGNNDKIALYDYLVDVCKITREEFPAAYDDYFRLLRKESDFRREAGRQSIEITLLQQDLQRKYKSAAMVDRLTGVFSRYAYQNDLAQLGTSETLIFAVIDINRLKYINDTYGHDVGDAALVTATEWMKECFSDLGKIYRYGGDEFYIIADCAEAEMRQALEKINQLSASYNEKEYRVDLSVGYACMKDYMYEDVGFLIRLADRNMYEAKNEYYRKNGLERRK